MVVVWRIDQAVGSDYNSNPKNLKDLEASLTAFIPLQFSRVPVERVELKFNIELKNLEKEN